MTNKTVSIVIGTYTTPTSFREIKVYKVGKNLRIETAEALLQASHYQKAVSPQTHERHQSPHAVR